MTNEQILEPTKMDFFLGWFENLVNIVACASMDTQHTGEPLFPLEIDVATLTDGTSEYPVGECSVYLEQWEFQRITEAHKYYASE